MSTSAIHAHTDSSWKQEVNRRLAEHRGRKPSTQSAPEGGSVAHHAASSKAHEAAARVAARYANAPSYSEMLATEARAALRAAEAASKAALQAKAAAESVLANIEAAAEKPQPFLQNESIVEVPKKRNIDRRKKVVQPLSEDCATELPVYPVEQSGAPAELPASANRGLFVDEWWKLASVEPGGSVAGEIQIVDPAQPIPGNLIEFPRELVATRKVRPRLTESPNTDARAQLSIFEVDPLTIATELSVDAVQASGAGWSQPAWSGLELDAQPNGDREELLEESAPRRLLLRTPRPASFNHRIMALLVDGALIAGGTVSTTAVVLRAIAVQPGFRTLEIVSGTALVAIAALYATFFYILAEFTPGMKYAGIRFCTFAGLPPTRSQRWNRLIALLLSVLPAGLGLAWCLFDDDNLCLHDRLSQTYICNC